MLTFWNKSTKKLAFVFDIRKICVFLHSQCPDGGIGRRAGLKHQWIHFHAGSIPALGTLKKTLNLYK